MGAAVQSALGCTAINIDTAVSRRYDLTRRRRVRRLAEDIARGLFFMLHFAPPCSTWSRARIPRLRKVGRYIEGLPQLTAAGRRQLELGTALARATVELVLAAIASGIGFSLENPLTSMLFQWPPMRKIMELPGVYVIDLDYCRYGTPWRKPTRIITNVSALIPLGVRCLGDHRHQELRGRAPDGRLWSRIACPYPAALCAAYAEKVRAAVRASSLPFHDVSSCVEEKLPAQGPPPLADHWLNPTRWRTSLQGRWDAEEHINVQEIRVVSMLYRSLGRDKMQWGRRHLSFADSLVTIGALRKGRSSSLALLRLIRRCAACALAYDIMVVLRWVPTKVNWADWPSRGRRLPLHRPKDCEEDASSEDEVSVDGVPFDLRHL